MKLDLSAQNIYNFKKFVLTASVQAKRQKNLVFFVPLQFVFVGILIDFLAKTFPVICIVSALVGVIWYFVFPKIYGGFVQKQLGESPKQEKFSSVFFEINGEKFSYSIAQKPNASEIFALKDVDKILESENEFFASVERGKVYILFPKNTTGISAIEELKAATNLEPQAINLA